MLVPPRAEQRAAHDMIQQVQPQRVLVFARSVHVVVQSFRAGSHIADPIVEPNPPPVGTHTSQAQIMADSSLSV
jgi:hypothetical protein